MLFLLFADGSMLRTCAPIDVDDCKLANGVTYCYCKNELCNQPGRKLSNPHPGSGLGSSPHNNGDIHITNHQIRQSQGIIMVLLFRSIAIASQCSGTE